MKGSWKAFQRTAAALVIAASLFVYFRPLSVLFAAHELYLRGIGMRRAFVRVGAHRIHYLDSGGDGPPLVMVHGVASRAADAAPLYRALSRTHRIYALDLLGYGASDQPRDADYSVRMQADVVRGFMNALRIRRADVLGISMGGWVALAVAAEHPERVRRLVLVSSAGLPLAIVECREKALRAIETFWSAPAPARALGAEAPASGPPPQLALRHRER